MIYLDNISKVYTSGEESLSEVNINIDKGEFVCIVGYSGAGKTTLMKIILGEVKPTSGNIYFDSEDVSLLSKKNINKHRRRIGTIFQDFRLLPKKSVYENIAFAMEAAGKKEEDIKKDVPHVLKLVGLSDKEERFPNELSGGEKQRVAIARAIVNNPDLIIADEPTGNLDPINSSDIIEILKKINEIGTTVILTTHEKNIVNDLGKRVITLDRGKVTRDDKKGTFVL